jgi:MFS family permease
MAVLALVAMLAIYFFSFFQRSAVPGTIFNELQREWGFSASQVTALGSIFLWIYGGMQLFLGIAVDRFGGTRTLLVGGLLMAVGATLFPLSRSLEMLYASRALTAFGASFMFLCIVKELSLLFENRFFAPLLGVVLFVGYCGGMAAMLPFERAVHFLGWRHALLIVGLLTCAAVGVSFLFLKGMRHFVPGGEPFTLRPLWGILCNRKSWPVLVCSFINFPIYFVIQAGIGKKLMQDFAHLNSPQAATFTLIMMAVGAAGSLASGPALHLFGGRRKPVIFIGIGLILGATLLMLAGVICAGRPLLFLTSYVLLAAWNVANPVMSTMMKELNDPRYVAQAVALLNGLAYFGVAVMLTLSGGVLDLFNARAVKTAEGTLYPSCAYGTLFAVLAFFALISLIATTFISETRGHPLHRADLSEGEVP